MADGMDVAGIIFAEDRAEELTEWIVEGVQPDHWRGAKVAVVMPGPAWREDKITRVHGNALALDGRVCPFAFDDEPQCVRGVAVCWSDLAGLDYLQPAIERIGDVAGAGEAWILQHEHATFCFFCSDELNRAEELRTHIPVAPDGGNGRRARPHPRGALPQRLCVQALEIARQARQLWICHGFHEICLLAEVTVHWAGLATAA